MSPEPIPTPHASDTDVEPEQMQLFDTTPYETPEEPDPFEGSPIPRHAITGFSVFLNEDGNWTAYSDMALSAKVQMEHEAQIGDFLHGTRAVAVNAEMQNIIMQVTGRLEQTIPQGILAQGQRLQSELRKQQEADAARNLLTQIDLKNPPRR